MELDASLKVGAAGEIGRTSTTKIAVSTAAHSDRLETHPPPDRSQIRKGVSKKGGNIKLSESSDKPVAQQLRDILSKNAVRVVDLFREWDEDGNGSVSKKEFRKAMPLLGFDAPRAQVDQLFDTFDPDGGGAISIDELNKALRRVEALVDRALRLAQLLHAERRLVPNGRVLRLQPGLQLYKLGEAAAEERGGGEGPGRVSTIGEGRGRGRGRGPGLDGRVGTGSSCTQTGRRARAAGRPCAPCPRGATPRPWTAACPGSRCP